MMTDLELLKAAISVAVADGELRRSELGVVEELAKRVGVGKASYDAMVQAAQADPHYADSIHLPAGRARQAIVLLVGQARIDGEISGVERRVIVRIANGLGVQGEEFRQAYDEGIRRADTLRRERTTRSR
jgi:uncharacterized tellurite resistance protein B-like protein